MKKDYTKPTLEIIEIEIESSMLMGSNFRFKKSEDIDVITDEGEA